MREGTSYDVEGTDLYIYYKQCHIEIWKAPTLMSNRTVGR